MVKDVMLGDMNIPKPDEEINEKNEKGKILIKSAVLNKMAFAELILSIDVRSKSSKIIFSIIKGCKIRDYTVWNSSLVWDKLKEKFDPVSPPSFVKTERAFRQSKLEREEDPEIWINNVEELQLKLDEMDSHMTDSQFMVQVLNSLTNDYEFQVVLMENALVTKKTR
jgi:hypothetical protein